MVQLMPVKGSPMFRTITPAWHCTSPGPAKGVSRQPARVRPSNIACHPCPVKGAGGRAAPGGSFTAGASLAAMDDGAGGCDAAAGDAGLPVSEAHPAANARTAENAKGHTHLLLALLMFLLLLKLAFCAALGQN